MHRRRFVAAATTGLLLAPMARVVAQPQQRIARIGFLGPTAAAAMESRIAALRSGLREYGYVEGTNLTIEFRWADEKYERLPALAAELVSHNVDVIVTGGAPGVRAAKSATTTIPIVIATTGDAVGAGLVTSLARPGGNVTGSTYFIQDLYAKRLELLKQAVPRALSVGVLVNPDNPVYETNIGKMERAAEAMNVTLRRFGARGAGELEAAFAAMAKAAMDAVVVIEDPMLNLNARRTAEQAIRNRLPSVGFIEFAEAGGMIGYGVNIVALYRRAAYFVDKILKGASPGELPVEQASRFELIVNSKTAKALDITIPQSLLLRADEVLQ